MSGGLLILFNHQIINFVEKCFFSAHLSDVEGCGRLQQRGSGSRLQDDEAGCDPGSAASFYSHKTHFFNRQNDMRTRAKRPRHEVSAFTRSDFTITSVLTDADVPAFLPRRE